MCYLSSSSREAGCCPLPWYERLRLGGGFEYKDGEHAERTLDGQTFVRMRSEEQSLFSEGKKVGAPFSP